MSSESPNKLPTWRPWLPRFGLRFLLVVVLAVALVCWKGYRDSAQDRAILALEQRGVELQFHTSSEPGWLRKKFSPVPPRDVQWVRVDGKKLTGPVSDDELSVLGSFPRLQKLLLSSTPINGRCLRGIGENRVLDCVHLSETNIDDDVLVFLDGTPNVQILSLAKTGISDSGAEHLQGCTKLSNLDLSNTQITDGGMHHLAKLIRLERLVLSNTSITDVGLESLLAFKRLSSLQIDGTRVTEAGIRRLASLPSLRSLIVSVPLLGKAQMHLRDVSVCGRKQGAPVDGW